MDSKYPIIGAIRLFFRTTPLTSWCCVFLSTGIGLVPSLLVLAEQRFVDLGVEIMQTRIFSRSAILALALIMTIMLAEWCAQILIKVCKTKQHAKIKRSINDVLLKKVEGIPYEVMEQTSIQDLVSRVMAQPEEHFCIIFDHVVLILQYVLSLVGLVALLFSQIQYRALIIVGAGVVLFYIARKSGMANYQMKRDNSLIARKRDYLQELLLRKEYADERYVYQYAQEINRQWGEVGHTVVKKEASVSAKWFLSRKIASIILYLISFVIIIMLVNPVASGYVTIGFLIAYVNATFNLSNTISRLLSNSVEKLYKEGAYYEDYLEFLRIDSAPEADGNIEMNYDIETIEFRDVCFTYPNAKSPTLSHCSFILNGLKKYALVGINGAGKSTIVKLIMGCYSDYTGTIFVNGEDMRSVSSALRANLFSIVNQDFAMYQISLRDNLTLGADGDARYTDEEMYNMLTTLHFDKTHRYSPLGLDAKIGKIYPDGIDLSHGEWQKISIARALLKPRSMIILDEPTASLDPVAESAVYSDIAKVAMNRLTLLISHRLGATKDADEILLLDNGAIIMQQPHRVLMEKSDVYRDMYMRQESWYCQ